MAGKPSPITPSVLAWAIAEDGRNHIDLATAVGVDEAVLDEWLEGESLPTVGEVSRLASVLRRPRAMFFMPRPPESASLPASFRHPPGDDRLVSAAARRSVRLARRMQSVISGAMSDNGAVDIPRYPLSMAPEAAASAARQWLGVTVSQQASWTNDYDGMHAWRAALDEKGIFVFALDIGGSSQRMRPKVSGLVSEEVRGFSAWDDNAPMIVVNARKVSAAARSFTLGHELGHLVTRVDAACVDPTPFLPFGEPTERWCEEFAAALLMPPDAVLRFARMERALTTPSADLGDVVAVKNAFRVSGRAAALRLIDLGLAQRSLYPIVEAAFRPKPPDPTKEMKGGTPRWKKRLRQFGPRALDTVFSEVSPIEALSILRMTVPDARELSDQVPSAGVL